MKWEDKIALNNHLLSLKEKNKNKEKKTTKNPGLITCQKNNNNMNQLPI